MARPGAPAGAQPDANWPADNRQYDGNDAPVTNTIAFDPETDVDKNGIIYDVAIHAKTKTQTQKGAWKRAKGVSQEEHDAKAVKYQAAAPAPQTEATPQHSTMPLDANGQPFSAPTPQSETQNPAPVAQGAPGMDAPGMVAPGVHQAAPLASQRTYNTFAEAVEALNTLIRESVAKTDAQGNPLISLEPNAPNSAGAIYQRAGVDMHVFGDHARQQNDLPGCLQEVYKALRGFEALG